jgi:L-aspartate oxidase
VQFHPTVLWRDLANRGQQPLISEAVRGEGAILLNNKNEQFMVGKHPQADLAPRDVVAIEIFNQMQISGQPYVWLDATKIKDFANRFPTIYASCIKNGIDPTKEKIPVAPASHYASGGVLVDLNGKSSVDGLYICGESACTGAHGANRLASNSLLEGLVFGARIAAALSIDLPAQQQPVEDGKSILLDPKILLPLQIAMSEGAGVLRSEASLTKTLQTLEELSKLTSKDPRIEAWEATNLHLLATVIVKSALLRTESRGSHWRSDYPQTQSNWTSRIIQQIDSEGNWQSKVEVI